MEAWYENDKIPSDWRIEISPNGWTSNEIGLRWLQNHFIPLTTGQSPDGKQLASASNDKTIRI